MGYHGGKIISYQPSIPFQDWDEMEERITF